MLIRRNTSSLVVGVILKQFHFTSLLQNFFLFLPIALYHHGFSASGGHYTLDVLHPNRYLSGVNAKSREGWVRIDDELVSDVRHDDVFGAYERDDGRSAYLLFYRRI